MISWRLGMARISASRAIDAGARLWEPSGIGEPTVMRLTIGGRVGRWRRWRCSLQGRAAVSAGPAGDCGAGRRRRFPAHAGGARDGLECADRSIHGAARSLVLARRVAVDRPAARAAGRAGRRRRGRCPDRPAGARPRPAPPFQQWMAVAPDRPPVDVVSGRRHVCRPSLVPHSRCGAGAAAVRRRARQAVCRAARGQPGAARIPRAPPGGARSRRAPGLVPRSCAIRNRPILRTAARFHTGVPAARSRSLGGAR